MHRRPLLISCAVAVLSKTATANNSLVISSGGSLPLLLTVPHDGDEVIGSVAARTTGATVRDLGTRVLAEKVASLLERQLKARPRLVIARFSRKYLDVKRPEQDAMQSAQALPNIRRSARPRWKKIDVTLAVIPCTTMAVIAPKESMQFSLSWQKSTPKPEPARTAHRGNHRVSQSPWVPGKVERNLLACHR